VCCKISNLCCFLKSSSIDIERSIVILLIDSLYRFLLPPAVSLAETHLALYVVAIISFVYQWFHKLIPSWFADYFKLMSSVHPYYTRQSNNDNLCLNQVQTTQYGLRSLCFSGVKLWNSLPLDIKQITSFSRFRQNVKNSMIDRYNKDTENYLI